MAFEDYIQNPLVQFGARLMAASDPRRQGLGGLGEAVTGTGTMLRQQAQLAEENERARMLADLQVQELQSAMAQRQAESEATEQFAAQEGLTPEQQAAIRAGYGQQVATAMGKGSEAPIAVMGPDGPIYVPRSEAVGMVPFKTPLVQIGDETKLPTGYMWADPNDKSKGVVPIPGGPKTKRTGETAGKEAMIDVARSLIPNINELVFVGGDPEGDINREVLLQKSAARAGVPGVMVPEGSQLAQNMEMGIQAITRIETGAAMPPGELANTRQRFEPSPLDADEVIRMKLKAYDLFMGNAKRYLDPTTGAVDTDLALADAAKEMESRQENQNQEPTPQVFPGLTPEQSQRLRQLRQAQGG